MQRQFGRRCGPRSCWWLVAGGWVGGSRSSDHPPPASLFELFSETCELLFEILELLAQLRDLSFECGDPVLTVGSRSLGLGVRNGGRSGEQVSESAFLFARTPLEFDDQLG